MDYFARKLDAKNRLTIPAEIRADFASGRAVITPGFGRYLHLYSQEVWDQQMEPALKGDILDERVADLNVRFRRGKSHVELDGKQGRITIEQSLLDHAGISGQLEAIRAGSYWRLQAAPSSP